VVLEEWKEESRWGETGWERGGVGKRKLRNIYLITRTFGSKTRNRAKIKLVSSDETRKGGIKEIERETLRLTAEKETSVVRESWALDLKAIPETEKPASAQKL
jgi:hypothetical protein